VPTLTVLQPIRLELAAADLARLLPLSQLRWLQWQVPTNLALSTAQTVQAFSALGLSCLTALDFHDRRLSDEELSQLLTPLIQLQELTLRNQTARSAAFLRAGSLPYTLRSLHLASDISAAELGERLPALHSLTALAL